MRLSISLALVLAATSPALADDKAKAKALYEEGLKHYNLAEWQDAIKSWKESYLLSKKPLLLFNIGQAYRLSGDCKQAGVFYDSYQREEPNPKNAAELEEALALCAKQGDKPVDKPIDKPIDKPVKPIDKPVTTNQTTNQTTNPTTTNPTTTNPTTTTTTTAPPNPTVTNPVVAQASEPAQPEQPVDTGPTTTGGGLRKIGIVVGGAGVVMGGLAIYFALDASSAASDLDGYTGEWGPDQIDLEAKGERSATLGKVLGGVGIAAIAAGGVMFAIGGPKAESSGVAIAPTRGGAAFSWSTRF